jgi:lysophospholipase L1-like esterase
MSCRALWILGFGLCFGCAAAPGPQLREPFSTPTPQAPPSEKSAQGSASQDPVTPPATPSASSSLSTPTPSVLAAEPDPVAPTSQPQATAALPEGTTVLHVGDSFAGALGPDLNREFAAQGVRGILKQEKATYIPTWASHKELTGYLIQYKPDLVLITLGANELGIVRPEERAEAIGRLVHRFGNTPCVWIGIPLWKGANPALLEVIRQNVAPCKYLDSNALVPELERAGDKIHPSLPARKVWAAAVVQWLAEQRVVRGERPWTLK